MDEIPDDLKCLYKTVWEISQKKLIDMAADRGAYIDQSQSFNVHIADPNFGKLTSMHFYAWRKVCVCVLFRRQGDLTRHRCRSLFLSSHFVQTLWSWTQLSLHQQ